MVDRSKPFTFIAGKLPRHVDVDQVMTETLQPLRVQVHKGVVGRHVIRRPRRSCAGLTPSLTWTVMTIDFRTRDDVDVETIDVADFFGAQLPRLAAERSELAVPGARELGVRPFTIETTAGTWTLSVNDDAVQVHPGGAGHAAVRLDAGEITDIVHDRRTPMTLLAAATLDMPSGDINDFLDWWVVLRSLLDVRPIHTAGDVTFTDRDGGPLDLQRSFRVDDDPAELAYYLGEAGYLHLTEVFTTDEMAQVSTDMDTALPRYHDGDGRSWWATTANGRRGRYACSDSRRRASRPPPCFRTTGSCASPHSRATGTCLGTKAATRSRRSSSPSASSRVFPTCRGTRTAASGGIPRAAAA